MNANTIVKLLQEINGYVGIHALFAAAPARAVIFLLTPQRKHSTWSTIETSDDDRAKKRHLHDLFLYIICLSYGSLLTVTILHTTLFLLALALHYYDTAPFFNYMCQILQKFSCAYSVC